MKHAAVEFRTATPVRPQRVTKRHLAKQRTRERVLAAAKSVFAERGFEAATIRDIATAAELSTGAVFANFTDKAELFDAVMAADYEVAAERMLAARAAAEACVVETLTAMFGAAYAFYLAQLPLAQAALSHVWARGEAAAVLREVAVGRVFGALAEVLQQAVDRGELSQDADVRLISEMLWDAYLANYRLAVFEGYGLEDLTKRTRLQTQTVLCGFLRR
jgi:AcrR family transcriptional regulator